MGAAQDSPEFTDLMNPRARREKKSTRRERSLPRAHLRTWHGLRTRREGSPRWGKSSATVRPREDAAERLGFGFATRTGKQSTGRREELYRASDYALCKEIANPRDWIRLAVRDRLGLAREEEGKGADVRARAVSDQGREERRSALPGPRGCGGALGRAVGRARQHTSSDYHPSYQQR